MGNNDKFFHVHYLEVCWIADVQSKMFLISELYQLYVVTVTRRANFLRIKGSIRPRVVGYLGLEEVRIIEKREREAV